MVHTVGSDDLFAAWVDSEQTTRARGHRRLAAAGQLRFAFYCRISTVEYQDEGSSRRWQHDCG
jgi:hypothetical protein